MKPHFSMNMRMDRPKEYTFSRRELYERVWSEPVRTVARRLGISDVGLAKACRKADIPLPSLGHWAKKEAGKTVRVVALPPRGIGKSAKVTVGGGRYHYEHQESEEELLAATLPPPPTFEDNDATLVERVRHLVHRVTIPTTLKSAHREVAKLLEADEVRRQRCLASSFYWDKPVFDTPTARRQLRIINGLFVALAQLGYPSSLRGNDPFELYTRVGDTNVSWKLESRQSGRKVSAPSGTRLRLEVHCACDALGQVPLSWEDAGDDALEKHRRQVLESVVLAGEYNYRACLIRQHEWRIERREQLEEDARRRAVEAEKKRIAEIKRAEQAEVDRLLDEARRWRQAEEIRAYVAATLATMDSGTATQKEEWARWARSVAYRLDPLQTNVASP